MGRMGGGFTMNWLRLALPLVVAGVMNGCVADPVGRFTFSVKDDEGAALPDIKMCIAGHKGWVPGPSFGRDEFRNQEGVTDTNGMLTLEIASDQGRFSYAVQKLEAYYPYYAKDIYLSKKDQNKWLPWDQKTDIVLKKKGTPVVMYAKRTSEDKKSKVDENNLEVGYDLMAGDWISPHGAGKVADFYVKFEHDVKSETDYSHSMTLRFPNEGDGVIPYPVPLREQDDLVLPRMAPETGYTQVYVEKRGGKGEGEDQRYFSTTTEDDNFFLRTRTVMKDGTIVSAYYGKVHGRILGSDINTLYMKYFLNPNPNDRNLEVDFSDNLIKNLTRTQSPTWYKNHKDYAR